MFVYYCKIIYMKRIAVVCIFLCFCISLFAKSSNQMLKEWNALSEDEKWLCLLTEPFFCAKGMSLTTVNPEPGGGKKQSKDFLEKDWKLHSKKDILNLIERYENGKWSGKNWGLEYAIDSFKKYPEASIDKIATTECMEIYQVVNLCFYAENKEKLGSHLTLALDAGRILSVIRWGVAVGWFTESEAVSVAKPLMTQLLNAYDSWEDYAVHFAIGWHFYAYTCGYYPSSYKEDIWKLAKKYSSSDIPDDHVVSHNIKFPAKNRNNNLKLTYADAEYTPSEEAEKWYLLRRALRYSPGTWAYSESSKYYDIVAEKENVPAVALLKVLGRDYSNNNAYSMLKKLKEWNSLSEYEKWFCLLAAPMREDGVTALNLGFDVSAGTRILENSFKVFSREELLNLIEEYRTNAFVALYDELKKKLNQNPKTTIDQIAAKECLADHWITKLYFVSETQDILDENGLIAYDYCFILNVLGLGVSSGWLSEKEALSLAEPFINELINAYDSWEDYAVHFVLGKVFSEMASPVDADDCKSTLSTYLKRVKKYDLEIPEDKKGKIFTLHDIKFPGKNRNSNRILTYEDAVYNPSENAKNWMFIRKYISDKYKTYSWYDYNNMLEFLKKNKRIPAAVYTRAILQSNELMSDFDDFAEKKKNIKAYMTLFKKYLKIWDEANSIFEKIKTESIDLKNSCYNDFYEMYGFVAYNAKDIKKMNFAISFLNEDELSEDADAQPLYCIYYTYKARDYVSSGNYTNAVKTAEKALTCLERCILLEVDFSLYDLDGYEEELKKMIEDYK